MRIEFDLPFEARERLWAVKAAQHKDSLTAGEFAQELLEKELRRLFPAKPEFDEQGNLSNPEGYRGGGDDKQALIDLLRKYSRGLAQAEYTAEVKDPLRMEIMDALWKAENLLTGEDALRKYKQEAEKE